MKNNTLHKKHCIPCEGNVSPFNLRQAGKYLKRVPGWKLVENHKKIEKDIDLKNFKRIVLFVNKVARLAEREKHHPDLFLYNYRRLRITLSTHAIDGLSENDFIMAIKINKLYKEYEKSNTLDPKRSN